MHARPARQTASLAAPLAAALALALAPGLAPAMTDAQLASIARQRIDGDRTGACLALAVVDGQQVSRAYACADAARPVSINADSAFEIGSVSKTMTSALLAQLIEEGRAALDDPLAAYLPDGTRVPAFEGKPIRLRHLVTHTSGLPALPPGVPVADPANPYAAMQPDDLLRALERSTLERAPGSGFEYSNFASMLLSHAVATRAGMDLETLLDQRLFAPLQMDGAYINQRPEGVTAATGHTPNGQPTPAWTFHTDLAGVGGVRATLGDMVHYVQGQLGLREAPVVQALARTQQPVATDASAPIAMNWMLAPLDGRTVHAHEGGTGGFSSFVGFDRERGRGVVVLSDTALTSVGGLGDIGLHLLDETAPLGKPREAAQAPDALLDALAGQYELQGGMRMELRREGDALVLQAAGQPAFEMAYDSAGDFFPLQFDALLRPVPSADGTTAFVWMQGGGAVPARRVDAKAGDAGDVDAGTAAPAATSKPAPAAELPAEALQAYAGEYPLMPGFALTVRARDGQLFAQAAGQGEFALVPAGKDVFTAAAFGIEIRFQRGADGTVSGLELLQGGQTLRGERR